MHLMPSRHSTARPPEKVTETGHAVVSGLFLDACSGLPTNRGSDGRRPKPSASIPWPSLMHRQSAGGSPLCNSHLARFSSLSGLVIPDLRRLTYSASNIPASHAGRGSCQARNKSIFWIKTKSFIMTCFCFSRFEFTNAGR